GSVQIMAPGGCTWSATTKAPWLNFTSATSGSGSGTVTYSVSQNMTSSPRLGTVAAGGTIVKVTEAPVTRTTVPGLYDPASSTFFLKNTNSAGPADLVFPYGPANSGWIPLVGDWNGDGMRTAGLYNPTTSVFFLKNTNSAGPADLVFQYGPANSGWIP